MERTSMDMDWLLTQVVLLKTSKIKSKKIYKKKYKNTKNIQRKNHDVKIRSLPAKTDYLFSLHTTYYNLY